MANLSSEPINDFSPGKSSSVAVPQWKQLQSSRESQRSLPSLSSSLIDYPNKLNKHNTDTLRHLKKV